MSVTILFFAGLREKAQSPSLLFHWPDDAKTPSGSTISVQQLTTMLPEPIPTILTATNLRCAVNHQMVALDHPVKDGDEVAFFPPVTGG